MHFIVHEHLGKAPAGQELMASVTPTEQEEEDGNTRDIEDQADNVVAVRVHRNHIFLGVVESAPTNKQTIVETRHNHNDKYFQNEYGDERAQIIRGALIRGELHRIEPQHKPTKNGDSESSEESRQVQAATKSKSSAEPSAGVIFNIQAFVHMVISIGRVRGEEHESTRQGEESNRAQKENVALTEHHHESHPNERGHDHILETQPHTGVSLAWCAEEVLRCRHESSKEPIGTFVRVARVFDHPDAQH